MKFAVKSTRTEDIKLAGFIFETKSATLDQDDQG